MINRLLRDKSYMSLWVCLIVGSTLRIWNFWKPSLWLDEFATFWAVSINGGGDLADKSVRYLLIPPTYFPFVKLSTAIFGKTEFALRLPSVLAGIASILLVFLLGRKTLSKEAGLLAAWCFALHPWFINQSQDARAYALAICFALLSSIALWRVIERVRIRDVVFFALASAGLIHCQYIFAPFIAYQAVFWLWSILRMKNGVKKRLLKFWLSTQFFMFLLLAPAFRHLFQLWLWRHDFQYQMKIDPGYLMAIVGPEIIMLISLCLSLLLFCSCIWILGRESMTLSFQNVKQETICYYLFWFLVPWPFYLIAWQLTGNSSLLVVRYFIIYLIPSSLLIGWLVSSIHFNKLKPLWLMLFLVINFFLYLAPNFARDGLFSTERHEDWRGLIRYLETNSPNDRKIVLKSGQIVADLILRPDGQDIRWKEVIRSPLGGFYLRSKWSVIDLPYHWETGLADRYFSEHVAPFVRSASDFWLVVRKDLETEDFLRSVREAVTRDGISASRETLFTERFGIILIHFEK